METEKYIIFKGTGGLTHMLLALDFCISKAIEKKRTLIIDTLVHPAFLMNFNEIFTLHYKNLKYYNNYNNIRKNIKYFEMNIEEIEKTPVIYDKGTYFIKNYNVTDIDWDTTNDIIIFAGRGSNYDLKNIKVVKKIKDSLDNEKKINEKYISGHFRNTDMKHDINIFISELKKKIKETNIKTFYLASDDLNSYEKIKKELPDVNIIRYTIPPQNINNLHYHYKTSQEKYKQIYELLRDMYFIIKSSYFIPSENSSLSKILVKMRKDKNNFFNI
jgi:hypothetical protein